MGSVTVENNSHMTPEKFEVALPPLCRREHRGRIALVHNVFEMLAAFPEQTSNFLKSKFFKYLIRVRIGQELE